MVIRTSATSLVLSASQQGFLTPSAPGEMDAQMDKLEAAAKMAVAVAAAAMVFVGGLSGHIASALCLAAGLLGAICSRRKWTLRWMSWRRLRRWLWRALQRRWCSLVDFQAGLSSPHLRSSELQDRLRELPLAVEAHGCASLPRRVARQDLRDDC
jgi:hypothetical protein